MQKGPDVKPVSRTELYPESNSSESYENDRTIEENLEERFRKDYLSSTVNVKSGSGLERATNEIDQSDNGEGCQEDAESYDFPLFSKSALKTSGSTATGNTISRIDIRSPSPVVGEPGFVHPHRLDSYYFTGEADSDKKERFNASAISGQDVLDKIRRRWRGYELPWRVIIWRTTRDSTVLKRTSSTLQGSGGRKRAGKKKRIATRKKLALLQSQRTQAALNQQEKDVADREKRTRRNREKKVKKKERDKSMKVAKSLDDK